MEVWRNKAMLGWLVYSKQDIEKNKGYIEFYLEEGKLLNMDIRLILAEDLSFGVRKNHIFMEYNQEEILFPDFVICRTIYPLLSKQFELLNIPVFNNSHVAEICNDKARTYQYVAQLGIPMVDSTFYKNERIENIIDLIKFPSVIKAVDGHGGNQVFLIEPSNTTEVELNKKQFIRNQLKCSNIVLQPLVGHKYQDLRVYVIGKTIVAAILRTAKEGFKSNFSLGGEVEQFHLSKEEIKLVKKIIKLFNFGLVGIDFIIGDQGELIFNEIEDVVGARMLYQCTDINLVRLYLNYIKENL
jgi:gamma-F420-2:alpha-L-glutamate ligase